MQERACEADWADLLLHPGERDWVIAECAQKLCCDGSSIPCAASQTNTGLSPGVKAGMAVAVIVVAALAAGAAGFVWFMRRRQAGSKGSPLEMQTPHQVNESDLDQRSSFEVEI